MRQNPLPMGCVSVARRSNLLIALCLVLTSLIWSPACPAQELKSPETLKTTPMVDASPTEGEKLEKNLYGSWKRAGYFLWDEAAGDYMEVAVKKEKLDSTEESWLFREEGRFRHIMGESLFFTGRWTVDRFLGARQSSGKARTFIIAVDVSGTMRGKPMDRTQKAIEGFVKNLSAEDEVSLVTFGDEVQKEKFGARREPLLKYVKSLKSGARKTRLFDGAEAALTMAGKVSKKSAVHILLLSDGKDEGSRAELIDLLHGAEERGVPVHSVGYSRVASKYFENLKALSRATGGQFYQAKDPDTLDLKLKEAFAFLNPSAGPYFVVHCTKVHGSIPGIRRDHDYFVATFFDQGRNLVVFYVGTSLNFKHNAFKQATIFERAPYGAR